MMRCVKGMGVPLVICIQTDKVVIVFMKVIKG